MYNISMVLAARCVPGLLRALHNMYGSARSLSAPFYVFFFAVTQFVAVQPSV